MADNVVTVPAATVEVKSGWLSKVNWTQIIQGLAMIAVWLTGGKLNIDATQQAAIIVTIGVIGNIVTFIMREYFTKTVTPASVTPTTTIVKE